MILCISFGDPRTGFTNCFMHEPCMNDLKGELGFEMVEACRLDEWKPYEGNQTKDRYCVKCKGSLDENGSDTGSSTKILE